MKLNRGTFAVEELVKVYGPPNLLSVMPGNKVMLRSGGPRMTVCEVLENGKARCQWSDFGMRLVEGEFDLACLTCYGAE